MFKTLFIEEHLKEDSQVQSIVGNFPKAKVKYLEDINEVFSKVRKPYLQKRTDLNLFLASKKGPLLREAPPAYGLSGEPHYYYIHAYNCIYECQYCYLQGYFQSPDLVLFLNHQEILAAIENKIEENLKDFSTPDRIWFHAGEFSDSLALSHLTQELPLYWDFFKNHPQAQLELRTKSVNIKEVEKLPPLPNVITSFSLSPDRQVKTFDLKTPSLKLRLKAIERLASLGHPIGIHLDPVIFEENFESLYQELIKSLAEVLNNDQLAYMSIGVVRFSKDSYRQMRQNYPDSPILAGEFNKSFDGKVRYNRPMRLWILKKIKSLVMEQGFEESKIYLCMED